MRMMVIAGALLGAAMVGACTQQTVSEAQAQPAGRAKVVGFASVGARSAILFEMPDGSLKQCEFIRASGAYESCTPVPPPPAD